MRGYKYLEPPGPTNFDYGWWDDVGRPRMWHANHKEDGARDPMEVYQSTLAKFSHPFEESPGEGRFGYPDFDREVFGVALAENYDVSNAGAEAAAHLAALPRQGRQAGPRDRARLQAAGRSCAGGIVARRREDGAAVPRRPRQVRPRRRSGPRRTASTASTATKTVGCGQEVQDRREPRRAVEARRDQPRRDLPPRRPLPAVGGAAERQLRLGREAGPNRRGGTAAALGSHSWPQSRTAPVRTPALPSRR